MNLRAKLFLKNEKHSLHFKFILTALQFQIHQGAKPNGWPGVTLLANAACIINSFF